MKYFPPKLKIIAALGFLFCLQESYAQYEDFHTVRVKVDFSHLLREWDGFGVNYVQTAHTRNYEEFPQEYGGFSLLEEGEKEEIIDLIFGENGIKPAMVKIFLDPLHQEYEDGPYDHETTTKYMLEFFERGREKTRSWGGDLEIVTTLYGPPAYTTLQKELRGRDMDPAHKEDIALYMIDWAKFLQDRGYPIKYISLHNEGEDWRRWAAEGDYANFDHGHDYNLYWRPEEVADFLAFMPSLMKENGLEDVGLTPGECSRFFQFYYSGYARSILENEKALENLSLITSHNFYRVVPVGHRWFAGTSNVGTDMIREVRPEMKAWVTSASWGDMDAEFAWHIWMNIYFAKINGFIPWACIQRPQHWVNKDPNPGTAIVVNEDGTYKVQRGYHIYKQIARAGQPGMAVAYTESMDSEIQLIGFGGNGTTNPDAFVVINITNYVPYRTDAVEVIINDDYFMFSNQDPSYNKHRQKEDPHYSGIQSASVETGNGYHLELAIPWENLDTAPEKDPVIDFTIKVREGAYSLAGVIEWEEDLEFGLSGKDRTDNNNDRPVIQWVDQAPVIDGNTDILWEELHSHPITESTHPNTNPEFQATWKTCFDKENMYLWIDITDPTHLQGRRVAIDLEGTGYREFRVIRSVDDKETYKDLGTMTASEGVLTYEAPPRSVTTFMGIK